MIFLVVSQIVQRSLRIWGCKVIFTICHPRVGGDLVNYFGLFKVNFTLLYTIKILLVVLNLIQDLFIILFLNKRSKLHHVPMGVVGIISPWNYPLSIPFGEVCMALMAGNASPKIIKPKLRRIMPKGPKRSTSRPICKANKAGIRP